MLRSIIHRMRRGRPRPNNLIALTGLRGFCPARRGRQHLERQSGEGPGDRLQDNQKRWLAFCAEQGLPVEVCYVQWTRP